MHSRRGLYRRFRLGASEATAANIVNLPFTDRADMRWYGPLNDFVQNSEGPFSAAVYYVYTAGEVCSWGKVA